MADNKLKPPPLGLEDFRPLQDGFEALTDAAITADIRPPDLVVMLLDAKYEREGRSTVVLHSGFEFHDRKAKRVIRVPRTYVTDFASIPWLARGLIESFGRHARAAVVHDWLYAINEGKRIDADKVAMHAMEALGVPWWKRWAIYASIRAGGGGGWSKMKQEWEITWADPDTGQRIAPPRYKQEDFHGGAWPSDPDLGFPPPTPPAVVAQGAGS